MAVNNPNADFYPAGYSAGDGIAIINGVVYNTQGAPSAIIENTSTNPATVTDFAGSYIVPVGAIGAWAGQAEKIASSTDSGATWDFITPTTGMRRQVISGANAGTTYQYNSTIWVVAPVTYAVGTILNTKMFDAAEITAVGSAGNTVLTYAASYTAVSASSYLLLDFDNDYTILGFGVDEWRSRIIVAGTSVMVKRQRMTSAGAGSDLRSPTLAPISGRYTNTSTGAKAVQIIFDRQTGDDSITWYSFRNLRITEIQR